MIDCDSYKVTKGHQFFLEELFQNVQTNVSQPFTDRVKYIEGN